MFSGGDICRSGVMRLVNRGFGYSWTFSPHLRQECTGLAFQTLSPVTRETPAALESTAPCRHHRPSPPPPFHPPTLHSRDITPVLGSRAWKEKTKISPAGGCSRWPADVHIVFWLLIDLRAVKSSWSRKARRCLFIYPSVGGWLYSLLDAAYSKWHIQLECPCSHTQNILDYFPCFFFFCFFLFSLSYSLFIVAVT